MFDENNPYAPPVENVAGKYDHSLFWRLVRVSMVFALFFLAIDIFFYSQYAATSKVRSANETTLDIVKGFFLDWKNLQLDD